MRVNEAFADTAALTQPGLQDDSGFFAQPPILLIDSQGDGTGDIARAADRVGGRFLGHAHPDQGVARLDQHMSLRLAILRLHEEERWPAALADAMAGLAEEGLAVLVILPPSLLDRHYGACLAHGFTLLCAPDDVDLAAVMAERLSPQAIVLNDIGRDSEAARMQALSEEMSRMAEVLARLSGARDLNGFTIDPASVAAKRTGYSGPPIIGDEPARSPRRTDPLTADDIRGLIRLRRLREQFLPADLFADPAWDMLLDLFAAELAGQQVSVSSLCIAAQVPPTTALRWIGTMSEAGLFRRQADPSDGRRVFISLAPDTSDALYRYFTTLRESGGLFCR